VCRGGQRVAECDEVGSSNNSSSGSSGSSSHLTHLAEAADAVKGPVVPYSLHDDGLTLEHVVVREHQLLAILCTQRHT
jgi:hypothetical protein